MRIDSIIQELDKRAATHERIAEEAYYVNRHDTYVAVARALRGAITLIESYRTDDDDSPANKET